jgi:diacylglycerol O-acyltransferase / wax synthase
MTMQQLSAQDAQFLYAQSANTLTHVMGIYIYDPSTAPGGTVRFKDIIGQIERRVDSSPVFKRRLHRLPLDIDYPYWVEDEHFDVEAHVTHARLPEPGDWRQFCIVAARHFSRPMDMTRPLWDVYVVEGLDRIPGVAPGSYALLQRMHHAAIDGVSGTLAFIALSDKDANGQHGELGRVPATADVIMRAVNSNLSSPVKLLNAAMKFMPALLGAAMKSSQPAAGENRTGVPQTRFNVAISPHKVFNAVTFALGDIGKVRALVEGATVNDVVLAICSGALRIYLARHRELPKSSLVAVAPVNARSRSDAETIPGNKISAMTVRLATTVEDPVKRLQAIREFTRDAKEAKSGLSARLMTDLTKHIPGATMAGVARLLTSERFAPRQTNLFITNVPGPQFPLYMNGAMLTQQFGMGPIANNMGLFIAALSYNGRVSFSVTCDRAIMPDSEFFADCIRSAFDELCQALPESQPRQGKVRKQKQS